MASGVWSSLQNSRAGLYALPVIAIAGCAIWLMLPASSDAQDSPTPPQQSAMSLNTATPAEEPAGPSQPSTSTVGVAPAVAPVAEASPLDGLKISSQSWRRGGLGSKALVTFTLRNANEYAVKDIEIACSFTRRDGRHLTDRKRLIGDTVEMKSRKTFAKMHVGFVNVNADKAKCSLVTASRASG
jgi:hypothetical protein